MRLSVKNDHLESPQFDAEEANLRVGTLPTLSPVIIIMLFQGATGSRA